MNITDNVFFIPNINELIEEIPKNSIVSRTIFNNDTIKVVLFAFDKEQELSQHTAEIPVIIHIFSGKVQISINDQTQTTETGGWAYLPAKTPHSILAISSTQMLLYLLK